jgi:glutamate dehydrogenase
MPAHPEQERNQRIDLVLRAVGERCGAPGAADAAAFARLYFARAVTEDILAQPPEALAEAVLSLWRFGGERKPGTASLRAVNPPAGGGKSGAAGARTVIEIVNDDMPFLVDSVAAALGQGGWRAHQLIHPIVAVRRDAKGHRLGLAGDGAAAIAESMMHIEIARQGDARVLAAIEASLAAVLADVRAAVEDWPKMLARLGECLESLRQQPPPVPPEEINEAQALLEWMRDNHFTALGYRAYDYAETPGKGSPGGGLGIVAESGLGILRDPARRIMRLAPAPAGGAQGGAPGGGLDMPPEVYRFLRRPELLVVFKANVRATVHRPAHLDCVAVKRFDAAGRVIGERRFAGLFTSTAYSSNPRSIPYLRRKISRVMDASGLAPNSHDGKALQNILDTYPRDELFQISEDDLARIATGILQLQMRARIRLFVRRDEFQRFVSCLVYVPREQHTNALRRRFESILANAYRGRVSAQYTQIGDEPLARLHIIIATTPGDVPDADIAAVEAKLVRAARTWRDDLLDALAAGLGEDEGNRRWLRYADAFPTAYAEAFDAAAAVFDIGKIEGLDPAGALGAPAKSEQAPGALGAPAKSEQAPGALGAPAKSEQVPGALDLQISRPAGGKPAEVRVKLYRWGDPVTLSDCLPVFEHMGLKVLEERPFRVEPAGAAAPCWIHDFGLIERRGNAIDLERSKAKFETAFHMAWTGAAEDDGFNRLVLLADLDWREVACLRALAKYLRQTGIAFSQAYMEDTLAENAGIARQLIELFHARFDPARPRGDMAPLVGGIEAGLDAVKSLDQDRILRRFLNLALAALRTNYYQRDANGDLKPALAIKFDGAKVAELPQPRPYAEIFVYSPRFEGTHLRGGKVSRGGIRWSDRREDFRNEILGLLKAQMVKNAVIVPVGAKGGFVPKRPPADGGREAVLADGVACYKTFIGSLLDITDNIVGGTVAPPPDVVRHDGDDPYLVVAADKGTATFSDTANQISRERGFWLDDAFASGGSAGYDHKKMGITARGGWELVKRHFREIGRDIQRQDFTVVGIGDMSGDVFGNAMLLSSHIRLIGAFDHRHIFVDPDPDAAASLGERQRLFGLPRSSWADYNPKLLSGGGAVFERSAKSLKLAPQIMARLGLGQDSATPAELIRALLTAEVDLLWNGGIGTFVKASDETHAEVGDRNTDALRVDAKQLRAKVIGEGGNLGFTQRARIEYALNGGRINSDAVDNSAGVDCSDHEVNIKILLGQAVGAGQMTVAERDALLARMTDDVAALVLRDNYLQGQAISQAEAEGPGALEQQARLIRALERRGLNRALEFLPDDEALAERRQRKQALTRPELAVLMAYAKTTLYGDLVAGDLPEDAHFAGDLARYFPRPLRQAHRDAIQKHQLRREIVATVVANSVVNRIGFGFVSEVAEETNASVADIARAYTAAREVFALRALWTAIEDLDTRVPAPVQLRLLATVRATHRHGCLWFLKHRAQVAPAAGPPAAPARPLDVAQTIAGFAPGIAQLAGDLAAILPAAETKALAGRVAALAADGVPEPLAARIAALTPLASALDVVAAAAQAQRPVTAVGRIYFALGARLGLDWLRQAAAAIAPSSYWERQAVTALIDDIYGRQRELTAAVLNGAAPGTASTDGADALAAWAADRPSQLQRIDQMLGEFRAQGAVDLAKLAVAARAIHAAFS